MKQINFTVMYSDIFDVYGLVPDGVDDERYTPITNGGLLAHDVVEHINGIRKIGSFTDEFEALGALMFVRGNYADFGFYSAEESIASDFTFLAEEWHLNADEDLSYSREPRKHYFLDTIWEYIEGYIKCPDEMLESERHYFINSARVYFKRGYLKASRKYPDEFSAYQLFDTVKYNFEKMFPTGFREHQEGTRIILRYDVQNAAAKLSYKKYRGYDY